MTVVAARASEADATRRIHSVVAFRHRVEVRSIVLSAALACVCFDSFASGAFPSRLGLVGPTELLLLVLAVLRPTPGPLDTDPRWRVTVRSGRLLLLGAIVAFAVHPTGGGLSTIVRWAVAMLVVGQCSRDVAAGRWRRLAYPLTVAMTVQALVVAVQLIRGGTVGLRALGEAASSFKPLRAFTAAPGTTVHPNELAIFAACVAGLLLVVGSFRDSGAGAVRTRRMLLVGLTASGFVIGQSTSRAALLGVVGALAVSMATNRRRLRAEHVAITVATLVGMAIARHGWLDRVAQTASASASSVGSGRVALARQSLALIRSYPVFGVGPGNWVAGVLADPRIERMTPERLPVHNVVLYALALLGVVGTALAVPAGFDLMRQSRRVGRTSAVLLAPVGVALSIDIFLLVFNGRTMLAMVVGTVAGLALRPDPPDPAHPTEPLPTEPDEVVGHRPLRQARPGIDISG